MMSRKPNPREIKDNLIEEFNSKCGYCGSGVGVSDPGNIGRFVPRRLRPELAYEPENLILICTLCDVNKRDIFPVDENGIPLLLNPKIDNFSEHIKINEDGYAEALTEKGETTIRILQLNRPGLVEKRKFDSIQTDYYREYVNSLPKAYEEFQSSLTTIRRLNSDELAKSENDSRYITNMLYANVITALESYLLDAFISKIKQNRAYLISFVRSFPKFKNEKFSLSEIFDSYEKIDEKVIGALKAK